ncbi:MAG: HD domain-containing protein, partial [Sediminibacterium sp.]
KSVVAAENMLVKIIERAQWLLSQKDEAIKTGSVLDYFLGEFTGKLADIDLNAYCQLDDTDILSAIKKWQHHSDPVISLLCNRILNRKSFKCKMQDKAISEREWNNAYQLVKAKFPMNEKDLSFLCFKGEATNTLYKNDSETIKILLKTGQISTISQIQNALINESLSAPVKKFYICLLNE